MAHDEPFLTIAHRGASGLAPENTQAALEAAIAYESDYAEIDVNLTRDGHVVLLHDDSLQRTTGMPGKINRLELGDIRHLDAGSWFGTAFSDQRIPTLIEAVRLVRGRMKLNIEIKSRPHRPGLARSVAAILEAEEYLGDCMVTSFDRQAIEELRRANPDITAGLITSSGIPSNPGELFDLFCCHSSIVDRDLVSHAHNAGKKILVWTVNQMPNMRRFIKIGVDGIITDRPDRLRDVRRSPWFRKNRS